MSPLDGKNIYLMGFMATGKSYVGRELAKILNWPFVDTDTLIEERAARSISAIFSEMGETVFRDLESEIILELAGRSNLVVALGGGAVLRPQNWDAISASGLTICLTASAQVLRDRIVRKNTRPLLSGHSREEMLKKIVQMLGVRTPSYAAAQYFFESSEQVSASALARTIYDRMQEDLCK